MEVVCYLVSIDEASDVHMCVCAPVDRYIMDGTTTTPPPPPPIKRHLSINLSSSMKWGGLCRCHGV